MNPQTGAIVADLRARLEGVYGGRLIKLVLFGSQDRGDAEPDSDIDVLVVLQGPISVREEMDRNGEMVAGLCLEHDVVITCIYMDEERFNSERSPLLLNVRREGVVL